MHLNKEIALRLYYYYFRIEYKNRKFFNSSSGRRTGGWWSGEVHVTLWTSGCKRERGREGWKSATEREVWYCTHRGWNYNELREELIWISNCFIGYVCGPTDLFSLQTTFLVDWGTKQCTNKNNKYLRTSLHFSPTLS